MEKQAKVETFSKVLLGCIGCALIVAAVAADQQWFDRHFLPSFWTDREAMLRTEQEARIAVAIAGALTVLLLRQPVARLVGKEPSYVFTIALAVVLAVGTAELVLRVRAAHKSPELNDRIRHWDPYLGCFVDRAHIRHDMLLGRDYPLVFDPNGYRVANLATVVDFNAPSVVMTGESIIVGVKLKYSDTIAAKISDALKVQTANIAIPGLSTDQAFLRLARELPRFRHPVAVVSLFTPMLFDRDLEDDRPHVGRRLEWLPPAQHWYVTKAITRAIQYRSVDQVERGIVRTREILAATVRLAREHGAKPLIVVPEFGAETAQERELRRRILDEPKLPYVLVALDPDDRVDNDGHPDADGASTIADAVVEAFTADTAAPYALSVARDRNTPLADLRSRNDLPGH